MKPIQRYREDKVGLTRLRFVLLCFALAGCRSTPPPIVTPQRYIVWDKLIARYPLWKSMETSKNERQFEVQPLPDSAPFAPLPASVAIPDTQAEERQQAIVTQTDSLRKQYARSLEEADAQRIEREAGLKRKELTAVYRRDVQDLAKKMSDAEDGNRRYIAIQVQNLGYYEVIYKTALEQQGGADRDQRFAKLERVRTQIRHLQALLETPKPDMTALAESRLKSRLVEIERQVGEFRAELSRKAQADFIRAVTQAGVDLKAELQAISPLKTAIAEHEPLPAVVSVSPAPQQPVYQTAQENRVLADSVADQIEAKSRVAREALIRRDAIRAIDVMFAKRGWKRVEQGTKGATDATEEAIRYLREQWSRSIH